MKRRIALVLLLCSFLSVFAHKNEPPKLPLPSLDSSPAFRKSLTRALKVIGEILETTKNPKLIEDVDHEYDDKYNIVEFMINIAVASILNVMEKFDGFNEDVLKKMIDAVQRQHRSLNLRLEVQRECEFLQETSVKVESPISVEEEETFAILKTKKIKSRKIVTEVKEYHWKLTIQHRLVLFPGRDQNKSVELCGRESSTTVVTRMKKNPFPPSVVNQDVNLTILLQLIDASSMKCCFAIDREQAKTPRRNQQVEEFVDLLSRLGDWSNSCRWLQRKMMQPNNGVTMPLKKQSTTYRELLEDINAENVFVPILPLFLPESSSESKNEDQSKKLVSLKDPSTNSPLISLQDVGKFLEEQCSSLEMEITKLEKIFPKSSAIDNIVTVHEARLALFFSHLEDLTEQCIDGIQYIEDVLRQQLIQAIGKEVDRKGFDTFQKFHNQRIFSKQYSPKPFCYAIRQPNQYPDGLISIVTENNESKDPIETFVRRIPEDCIDSAMLIPLNAATTVQFCGDQYLHGWINTFFASEQAIGHRLCARARQFSCFLLVIGKMSGQNEFTPKDGIILLNKDEILIPLLLSNLSSSMEFRDAIKSLSPEQARFANSFREMQLDSSVFGICIVQVKPQLELLLGLPPQSLTKEIQLTQDLLSLFVEYQIPTTLVSYDGPESESAVKKVSAVKKHVKAVMDVIQSIKHSQLNEEAQKADMRYEKESQQHPPMTYSLQHPPSTYPQQQISKSTRTITKSRIKRQYRKGWAYSDDFADYSGENYMVRNYGSPTGDSMYSSSRCTPMSLSSEGQHVATDGSNVPPKDVIMGDSSEGQYVTVTFENDSEMTLNEDDKHNTPPKVESHKRNIESMSFETQKLDFSAIPKQLDQIFESFDYDSALRSIILSTGPRWKRKRQQNLLLEARESDLGDEDQQMETNKALDLLDALSRSGSLPILNGELHVIIAIRHSFEQNLIDTIIKNNINPIEKIDFSSLLIASSIHGVNITALIAESIEKPTRVLSNRKFPLIMMEENEDVANDLGGDNKT